ncbi:unnamed protein product [Ectocarpus sp. 12 AP-2014]
MTRLLLFLFRAENAWSRDPSNAHWFSPPLPSPQATTPASLLRTKKAIQSLRICCACTHWLMLYGNRGPPEQTSTQASSCPNCNRRSRVFPPLNTLCSPSSRRTQPLKIHGRWGKGATQMDS